MDVRVQSSAHAPVNFLYLRGPASLPASHLTCGNRTMVSPMEDSQGVESVALDQLPKLKKDSGFYDLNGKRKATLAEVNRAKFSYVHYACTRRCSDLTRRPSTQMVSCSSVSGRGCGFLDRRVCPLIITSGVLRLMQEAVATTYSPLTSLLSCLVMSTATASVDVLQNEEDTELPCRPGAYSEPRPGDQSRHPSWYSLWPAYLRVARGCLRSQAHV